MSSATVTYHELPPVSTWATASTASEQQFFAQTGVVYSDPPPSYETLTSNTNGLHHWNGYSVEDSHVLTPMTPGTPQSPSWTNQSAYSSGGGGGGNIQSSYGSQRSPMVGSGDVRSKKRLNPTRISGTNPGVPEELCLVCGDKASGYHYNALTCEGCKGFFRRSITRKAMYYCKYGGNCDIDMYMRRKCQACRLRKCLDIGMRPELVIPEDQCRMKRESKLRNRAGSEERKSSSPQQWLQVTSTESLSPSTTLPGLTVEQKELIHRLVMYQEQFDMPADEEIAKLSTFQEAGKDPNSYFQHLAELTILTVQLIMEFTKHLPGFSTLCKEDQLTLLKACSTEILMLRTSKRYDPKRDTIVLGNQTTSWAYNREAYRQAGIGLATDAIFDFAKSMAKLKVDGAEYALLTAVTIFSERPGLIEPKKVEDIQEVYTSTLQAYIDVHRPKHRTVFARLLMKLTDLRTLGSEHADLLFPSHSKPLPPLVDHRPVEQNFSSGVGNYNNSRYQTAPETTTLKYDDANAHLTTAYWSGHNCYPSHTGGNNGPEDISTSNPFISGQQQPPANYRMPNVRIKVEPISGEESDSRKKAAAANPTSPMLGDLLEKAVASTFPDFKMEH